nr:hypothetical protein pC5.8a_17 [Rhizobium rhizogenes]
MRCTIKNQLRNVEAFDTRQVSARFAMSIMAKLRDDRAHASRTDAQPLSVRSRGSVGTVTNSKSNARTSHPSPGSSSSFVHENLSMPRTCRSADCFCPEIIAG